MKRGWLISSFLCASLTLPAAADTLVGAGATLTVTNSEDLGFSNIQLGTGSTLLFAGAAGAGGLSEYLRTGAGGLGTPYATSYGTWQRVATNAYYASVNFATNSAEYIYTGRWHVPSAGTYSFYENIDDAAALAVDGATVLQNTVWNQGTCVRNISLAAGWHDLELRLYNGGSMGGPLTNTVLASGILYSPSNTLISVANQTDAFPFADPADGSALRPVHNGVLFQKIFVAGSATFDLTAYDTGLPLALTASLLPAYGAGGATVTVAGGCGELAFGTPNLGAQYTPFNADVTFTGVSNPAGVTFRDYATLISCPTSCPWRVANNATVALYGTNLFGAGDITLTNHNLYVLSPFAVASDATIHVQGTNLTAALKPCSLDSNGWWTGWAVTLTNDIALEGTGATALFPINVDLTVQGRITGTGTVTKTGNARTQIKEPCTFVGPVSVSDSGTFVIEANTAGHSNNTVTVNSGATFGLYPAGYGTVPTAAWIKTLRGSGTTGKVYAPAFQTLTVDRAEGAVSVEGGAAASLHLNTLGSNATLRAAGTLAVTIDTIEPGATLVLNSDTTPLTVTSSGATLDSLILTSGSVPVSGGFTVAVLGGAGKLVKQGADTLSVYFSTNTAGVQVDAGKVVLAPPAPETVLGNLPALWLDAAATNVFTQYKSYVYTNGFKNIERWNDCRPGAPVYAYNNRGEDNYQVYPFVMTNDQNGLSVVSMGSYQGSLLPPYAGTTGIEARRIYFSTNVAPLYAVMMFGSQQGGGAAALGGNAALQRAGSTTSDFRNPATPILASGAYPVWTNGVAVTATNTGFTGGYQILSVNTKGLSVNALGWKTDYANAGGQNYGEVLLYTNALTTLQRMTAEAYLASKWGLPYPYAAPIASATVAAGATLEVGGTFAVGQLYGAGNLTVASGAAFQLSGLFTGTVTVSGTLAIPDMPFPPTASGVPTNALTAWFDPSVTNRVVFGGKYTPARPLAVAALFDRTTTNRYLFGSCNTDLTYDRRPWLAVTNNPLGETLYWLDYTNVYSGDVNGNTLRFYRNPAYIGTATTGQQTPTNVQSGFIVLDSSRGGGVPITFDVNATQVFTRDNPLSAASPIWGSATASPVKSGQTFLDGVSVSGASRGYSGTTELLSFVATNIVQAAFFGWYGNETSNRERLGEILLFESALSDAARADVEAYLMKKWLGKARAGYSDATAATVTGSGTVSATQPQLLPALGAGFTGSVALTAAAFEYTLATNGLGQYGMTPATAVPGCLSVAPSGTLTVHFAVKPPAGAYPVMTYGSVAGQGFAGWTLAADGAVPAGTLRLKQTATALTLTVASPGTVLMLQ